MRVYTISDIHIDYTENAKWVYNISKFDFTSDILILAGDVSQRLKLIDDCFKHLCACFKKVLFVPGNHDLWITDPSENNSLKKFSMVKDIASFKGASLDVYEDNDITIVPLFSWYDYSFAPLNDLIKKSWMDFYLCKWPDAMNDESVNDFFIDLNKDRLNVQNKKIISFSHFMPRIDIISNFIPNKFHYLFPVMGSLKLEEQLRILKPNIHIYGHSHVSNNKNVDNINYICNPYGYPQEPSRFTANKLKLVYEQ